MKQSLFVIKTSVLFCALSAGFSLLGILFAEKGPQPNPTMALTAQEVLGHLFWGLIVGAATLSLRYTILAGLFALLIDSDHLIALAHIDAISRMSHSISFGVLASVVLMISFGRKNYLLGAVAFSGMLAHLSYDTFAGDDAKFPIFAPFYNQQMVFPNIYWIFFEVAAIALVGIVTLLYKKKRLITN